MGSNNRVRLMCNHGSCVETFGRNHTAAHATRTAAAKAGWDIGTREDRRDFCPEHAGMKR